MIALLLYYRGLRTTPAPVATFAELAFPATALVVNYLYLDATIDFWQFVGLVVLWGTIAALHLIPVKIPIRPTVSRASKQLRQQAESQAGPPVAMMKWVMPAST